jgi:L-threonylcarbamoyladenylate synthase
MKSPEPPPGRRWKNSRFGVHFFEASNLVMIHPATQEAIEAAAAVIAAEASWPFRPKTVYGLGADALNPSAVGRNLRGQEAAGVQPPDRSPALAEQIPSVAAVEGDARLSALLAKLERFWPGPLSVVLPKKDLIPGLVTGGLKTVAVRVPAHTRGPGVPRSLRLPESPRPAPTSSAR